MFPRFSKLKSAGSVIDVKAKAVKGAVPVPKAIASRMAPSLGDYSQEYPEPPPAWGKAIPFIFWASVLCFAGWIYYSKESNEVFTKNAREVQRQLSLSEEQIKTSTALNKTLEAKAKDLSAISKWVESGGFMRDVVAACFLASNERVQVRVFELKRREGISPRYSLIFTCVGTRQSFDAMRIDLASRLSALGWSISELIEPDEGTLRYEATISRKTS